MKRAPQRRAFGWRFFVARVTSPAGPHARPRLPASGQRIGRGSLERLVLLLIWILAAPLVIAASETEFELRIPAMEAEAAIKELSRQTGHSAIYRSGDLEAVRT